ncbi:zf-HC2 domain-containing protein [Chloroflexota bacterium]
MSWFKSNDQCRKVQNKLSAYIDGILNTNNKSSVEQHLKECEICHRELESLKITVQLIRRMPQMSVPRSFAVADIEPIRVNTTAVASPRWLRPATVFATFVLMALLLGDFTGVFEGKISDDLLSTPSPTTAYASPAPTSDSSLSPDAAAIPTPSTEANGFPPGKEMVIGGTPMPTPVEGETPPAPTVTPIPLGAVSLPTPELSSKAPEAQLETEGTIADGTGWPLRQIEIGLGAVLAILIGIIIYSYQQRRKRLISKIR